MAEGILQKKADEAGLNWQVDSAGTNGYHVGESPHRLSQKVAKRNGIDISGQCARDFLPEDFERFDKIYAMAGDVVREMKYIAGGTFDQAKVDLILNELEPGKNNSVPDPWYGAEPGYHEVYEMLDRACDAIISKYS